MAREQSRNRPRNRRRPTAESTEPPRYPGRHLGERQVSLWQQTNPIAQWQALQNIGGTVGNIFAITDPGGGVGFSQSDPGYTSRPVRTGFLHDVGTRESRERTLEQAMQFRAMEDWMAGQRLGYMPPSPIPEVEDWRFNRMFHHNTMADFLNAPPYRYEEIPWQARRYEYEDLLNTLPIHLGEHRPTSPPQSERTR